MYASTFRRGALRAAPCRRAGSALLVLALLLPATPSGNAWAQGPGSSGPGLSVATTGREGDPFTVIITGGPDFPPGSPILLAVSLDLHNPPILIPGKGWLHLRLGPWFLVLANGFPPGGTNLLTMPSSGAATFSLGVPVGSGLAGTRVYLQAMAQDRSGNLRLTNLGAFTVRSPGYVPTMHLGDSAFNIATMADAQGAVPSPWVPIPGPAIPNHAGVINVSVHPTQTPPLIAVGTKDGGTSGIVRFLRLLGGQWQDLGTVTLRPADGPTNAIKNMVFSEDGSVLFAAHGSVGGLDAIAVPAGQNPARVLWTVNPIADPGTAGFVGAAGAGGRIVCVFHTGCRFKVIDTTSGTPVVGPSIQVPSRGDCTAPSTSSGSVIHVPVLDEVWYALDDTIVRVNPRTGAFTQLSLQPILGPLGHGGVWGLTWHPASSTVFVTTCTGGLCGAGGTPTQLWALPIVPPAAGVGGPVPSLMTPVGPADLGPSLQASPTGSLIYKVKHVQGPSAGLHVYSTTVTPGVFPPSYGYIGFVPVPDILTFGIADAAGPNAN